MSETEQDTDREIVNMILGIAPDDTIPHERAVEDTVTPDSLKKKRKKKKKNGVDLAFEIIEKTIDLLLAATPKLLEAITSYLNAGGDPNVEIKGVPLVKVCESHPEVVELLLKYGAMGR